MVQDHTLGCCTLREKLKFCSEKLHREHFPFSEVKLLTILIHYCVMQMKTQHTNLQCFALQMNLHRRDKRKQRLERIRKGTWSYLFYSKEFNCSHSPVQETAKFKHIFVHQTAEEKGKAQLNTGTNERDVLWEAEHSLSTFGFVFMAGLSHLY